VKANKDYYFNAKAVKSGQLSRGTYGVKLFLFVESKSWLCFRPATSSVLNLRFNVYFN